MTAFLSEHIEPLMEKPGWQRIFLLAASLLILVLILYQFGLRGLWQQQHALIQEVATAQQALSQAQVVLMRLPPLEKLGQELADNAALLREILPLEQQFAQPLRDSQAALVHWQPVSQQKLQPQGELHLQNTFSGLMHFLYALMQRPEQPAFSEVNLRVTGTGMKASMLLTQIGEAAEGGQDDLAVHTGRDPFSPPLTAVCMASPLSDWLLSGISDTGGQRYGWLLSPQGRWNKIETGSQFGVPQWTVDSLSGSQVELSLSDARCGMQHQIIRLGQGNHSPGKGK